jgi:hypothetical protein
VELNLRTRAKTASPPRPLPLKGGDEEKGGDGVMEEGLRLFGDGRLFNIQHTCLITLIQILLLHQISYHRGPVLVLLCSPASEDRPFFKSTLILTLLY